MAKVQLKEIAYPRSADKGDVSTIGLIARSHEAYEQIKKGLTPEGVKAFFNGMVKGNVEIYSEDNIECFQVVCRQGLDGGATRTLRYDSTGKSLGCALLRMEIEVD